tara:strand:- start:73 stop:636 length:564 start_codon:yes stop_codon:yes gene_type:complete
MPDTEKYMNTMNLGREDDNKLDLKLGDICHIGGSYVTANSYGYCGYEEFDVPLGARVRIIGIKQTSLNGKWDPYTATFGVGDVYVDFELVNHSNSDGTPIRCGNRHAGCLAEASPRFAACPDGSGDIGFLWPECSSGFRWSGMWTSMMGESDEDYKFTPKKILDPRQYTGPDGYGTFHEYLTVSSCD